MGVDDLIREMHTNAGTYIGTGRAFGYLTMVLLGENGMETAMQVIVGVLLFVFGATAACVLFSKTNKEKMPTICYTIFSCLLISYPLNTDAWIYADTGFMIRMGYLFVPLSLYLLVSFFESKRIYLFVLSVLFLTWCAGSYEGLLPVYVCYSGAYLLLEQLYRNTSAKDFFIKSASMVFTLALSVLLSKVFAWSLMMLFDIPRWIQPTQSILWIDGSLPVKLRLSYLLQNIMCRVMIAGGFSLPYTLLDIGWLISLGFFIWAFIKKPLALPAVLTTAISPLLLSLLNGELLPARTCQAAGAFVAFSAMLVASILSCKSRNEKVLSLFSAICICISLWCAFQVNQLFHIEFEFYQHELAVLQNSHNYLESQYPNQERTPVVYFCTGSYGSIIKKDLSLLQTDKSSRLFKAIYNRLQFMPESLDFYELPNRTLEWAVSGGDWFPTHTPQQVLHKYLALIGCDTHMPPTKSMVEEAQRYKTDLVPYPSTECLYDAGDYLVLCIG